MDKDKISVRDSLERDERGVTRGTKNDKGRGRIDVKESKGNKSRGSNYKWYIFLIMVIILVVLFLMSGGGNIDFQKILKTFPSSAEDNMSAMLHSMEKVDRVNKEYGEHQISNDLYDSNRIYNDRYVEEMFDKEYAVYVYTKGEEDLPFNEWVKENDDYISIFRLHQDDVDTNHEIGEYFERNVPMVLIYNEISLGNKELDSVIKDPRLLEEIVPYMEKLQKGKDGSEGNQGSENN